METIKINSERWLSMEDFDNEVWKPVVGYEKYYSISNYGRLRSNTRHTVSSNGKNSIHKGRIVKTSINRGGYLHFRISVEGKLISVLLHRLVAMAFIPNPQNLPFVNHKDENPSNNCATNIEWCTNKYNINYKETQKRHSESLRKVLREKAFVVKQYSLDGNLIATYRGKREISDAGFSYDAVIHCCKHKTQSAHGYVWRRNDEPFTKVVHHRNDNCCKKVVLCYDLKHNLVSEYLGTKEAARAVGKTDKHSACISRCCLGHRPTAFGYIWKYKK